MDFWTIAGAVATGILLPNVATFLYDELVKKPHDHEVAVRRWMVFRAVLRHTLDMNIEMLREVEAVLSRNKGPWSVATPNIKIDPIVLEVTCKDQIEILADLEVYAKLERVRFRMSQIGRWVEQLYDFMAVSPPDTSYQDHRHRMLEKSQVTLKNVTRAIEEISEARDALDALLPPPMPRIAGMLCAIQRAIRKDAEAIGAL